MKELFIYFSDLHLKCLKNKAHHTAFIFEQLESLKQQFPDFSINLLAAGDISRANKSYTYDFFSQLCAKSDRVFYCFGNHEYYGGNLETEISDFKRKFSDNYSNLFLLENDCIEFEHFVIIGATLWTNFNNGDYQAKLEASQTMNDYKTIRRFKKRSQRIKASDISRLNRESADFIFDWLEQFEQKDKTTIVMTHHSPINTFSESLTGIDFSFCNDYSSQLNKAAPDYWIFGHTHQQTQINKNECCFLSNALGYINEYNDKKLFYFTI